MPVGASAAGTPHPRVILAEGGPRPVSARAAGRAVSGTVYECEAAKLDRSSAGAGESEH